MKKTLFWVLIVTCLAVRPACARPDPDGDVQRRITGCIGGIGSDLDRTGRGIQQVFGRETDTD